MIEKDNIIFFDNDKEFYDYCVIPDAVVIEDPVNGRCMDIKFTDMYNDAISQGKQFVIKDEDSKVARRERIALHTIVKRVKNILPYFPELYDDDVYDDDIYDGDAYDGDVSEGLKITADTEITEYKVKPSTKNELIEAIRKCIKEQDSKNEKNKTIDLNEIDTSIILDMSDLFKNVDNSYNFDVSQWNVSKVRNMNSMFANKKNFNCNISGWNVSNVKDMEDMFNGCKKFNADISKWDVKSLKNAERMFYRCQSFNRDLNSWTPVSLKLDSDMFYGCSSLKNVPEWSV